MVVVGIVFVNWVFVGDSYWIFVVVFGIIFANWLSLFDWDWINWVSNVVGKVVYWSCIVVPISVGIIFSYWFVVVIGCVCTNWVSIVSGNELINWFVVPGKVFKTFSYFVVVVIVEKSFNAFSNWCGNVVFVGNVLNTFSYSVVVVVPGIVFIYWLVVVVVTGDRLNWVVVWVVVNPLFCPCWIFWNCCCI